MRTIQSSLPLLVALLACGDSSKGLTVEPQCNPLGMNHCMTPWPSSAFEVEDSTTPTGRKLAIPDNTLMASTDGVSVDPAGWNQADGFSPSAPMVMSWKGGVSTDGLPPPDNMDLSLKDDSPTVIVDMTTGERVAHYAEVDAAAAQDPDSQALMLRPSARLIGGHRYAVGITKRVKAKNGDDLEVSPGFEALREGTSTDHALLEAMRPRFADVLAALDDAGVPADDLVVAWDFTVASDDFLHRDMIAARDRAIAALATHEIAFTSDDKPFADGFRKITGELDAPLFLTANGVPAVGTTVARDAQGLPALQGFYRIPFTALIPACALTAQAPVSMVIYGHGLLGTGTEAAGAVQQATAQELCAIFVGTDMRGMSTPDVPVVINALGDIARADEVMEVLEQGMVNQFTLVRAMRGVFAQKLFVDPANANRSLVDPAKVYWYGLSQGGILGTTFMAYEPTVTRAVLGVGAANYSTLLERSTDWPTYRQFLKFKYPSALDVQLAVSLFQMRWDKTEGAGVVNSVLIGTPTGTPPKQILMQNALGDQEVPNIGSYWQARTMGIPIMGPTPAVPWGLPVKNGPLAAGASGMVLMDGGAPAPPLTNIPPEDHDMHNLTRKQPASRRQIRHFFETGEIENQCSGACFCAKGACE